MSRKPKHTKKRKQQGLMWEELEYLLLGTNLIKSPVPPFKNDKEIYQAWFTNCEYVMSLRGQPNPHWAGGQP